MVRVTLNVGEGEGEGEGEGGDGAAVAVSLDVRGARGARKGREKRPKKDYSKWASAASQRESSANGGSAPPLSLGPRRPDGTQGFAMGRGRPPPVAESSS